MVDLINTFNVTKVKITNRVDCCWERINGAEIRIGDSPDNGGTLNPRCQFGFQRNHLSVQHI
ncbi:hypothetical protein GDO78_015928 [Eleutherodactylus coqui]|uniref:Uncharacterized protein n=1 Tax=Eleutherodactylus coqui TaxID=57060 RepID=A0A8J6BB91_ELECQ|nr:hypothetical protein GDO78_015928 [Eleutherodactylus coqui]